MSIKLILKKILPSSLRSKLKKTQRRLNNKLKGRVPKTTLAEMRNLLANEFGIKKGDNLIISSSFGNLNAAFTPLELIRLLQEIVGKEGNIVMPFYPPGNSYEWAKKNKVFDMKTTRSSMGILTQIFSEMPEVYKSMHPTKAVVAWGKNAKDIVKGHEKSKTPFYWDSPYGWLLKIGSKSLGLGIKSNPMFHCCEDILLPKSKWLYSNKKIMLQVRDYNGEISYFKTLVHDPQKMDALMPIGDYIKRLSPPSYKRVPFAYKYCYIIDNLQLYKACNVQFNNKNFRNK